MSTPYECTERRRATATVTMTLAPLAITPAAAKGPASRSPARSDSAPADFWGSSTSSPPNDGAPALGAREIAAGTPSTSTSATGAGTPSSAVKADLRSDPLSLDVTIGPCGPALVTGSTTLL